MKLGVPDGEYSREVEALRAFRGRRAVRLLKSDTVLGAIMLERLKPGSYLGDVSDKEQATSIAAGVMRRLWQAAPSSHRFPEVSEYEGGLEWLQGQLDGQGPLPKPLVARAEAMLRELLEEKNEPVVLDGDLHPWNILSTWAGPCRPSGT